MGLMVTPTLIWTTAKTKLANQANRAIISMIKMQRHIGYFDYTEYFKLFDTMIKPILCYAAEIWGYQQSDIIEKVHNQYCRKFLKLPSNKQICSLEVNVVDGLYMLTILVNV